MQRWRDKQWLGIAGLVVVLGACGTRTTGGEAADVAAADVGVTDAAVDEVLAEVDGTDGDVADVVVDLPDATDVQTPKDVPADVADSDTTPDIPYWIAHDVDISGLGTVNAKGAKQCDILLQVKPNDPPQDPTCTSTCAPPYPCTCGTCPWIQTPPMNVPREGAVALWTGEEVLVFGGITQTGLGNPGGTTVFTAEHWNPSLDKGFEMIDLPFIVTSPVGLSPWVDAVWTGKEAIVFLRDHQFTFDPKTAKVTELPLAPVTSGGAFARIFWSNDTLLVWGYDRASYSPQNPTPRIATWQETTGWQPVPPHTDLVPVAGPPRCAAMLDGDLYNFEPGDVNPTSGLNPDLPLMLRYSLATKTWTALPQTMLPNIHCVHNGNVMFEAFPDGIVFIPSIYGGEGATKYPAVGEIWWKATGKWSAISPPPITGPLVRSEAHWTGSSFVITDVNYVDPVVSALPKLVDSDGPSWPVHYDPYTDQFQYMTSVGFPKPRRFAMASVWTGSEIFMLGGSNGYALKTLHNEGFRYRTAIP